MYLGNIHDCINENDRYLTKILLITTKKAITRNWFKAEPPTIEQWKGIIREVYTMERMTFGLRLRENVCTNNWKKLIIYDTVNSAPTDV